ncbi:MAG: 2-C-methyl-D-erythritol 4-phosphate cytidylyltransferase [Chloroflexi bacterium]|nr:2-C-methyl-D-erythritol 4-phosphate cytidylyltransferase [Chloroflexota bacterium]
MTSVVGGLIVAAGQSARMGFDKVWAMLGERRVLEYSLELFTRSAVIARTALVVAPSRVEEARTLCLAYRAEVVVCAGGARRRDSVAAGVEALGTVDWLVVHDAARPFVEADMIERGLAACAGAGASVAAVSVRDTIKRAIGDVVQETLPRAALWTVQTPQVFDARILRRALAASDEDVTDEATLVEALGEPVKVFLGADTNWKITTPGDLELAAVMVELRERRARELGRSVYV